MKGGLNYSKTLSIVNAFIPSSLLIVNADREFRRRFLELFIEGGREIQRKDFIWHYHTFNQRLKYPRNILYKLTNVYDHALIIILILSFEVHVAIGINYFDYGFPLPCIHLTS